MKKVTISILVNIIAVFHLIGLSSFAGDYESGSCPERLASGADFAIHLFRGFIVNRLVEAVISPGIVISHTSLASGKMKWLVSTGVHSVPTRRISYSITRLVGLEEDDLHLLVFIYRSGMMFTDDNRPPPCPFPKHGDYVLRVFSKEEGNEIYNWAFSDPAVFPASVPNETTEAGLFKKTDNGFVLFDILFRFDESGKIVREGCFFKKDGP